MSRRQKIPWIETPLVKSTTLSEATGCNVFLKLENLQPAGSFKSRGIGNYMLQKLDALTGSAKDHVHFYSSSGGNAGLACVHAAVTLGYKSSVVVPLSTSEFIVNQLRQAGATDVTQIGQSWQEADDYLTGTLMVEAMARGEEAIYVPPFDAQGVWDGNATISHEIARQIGDLSRRYPISIDAVAANRLSNGTTNGATNGTPNGEIEPSIQHVDAVVCSVGGGGLFSGIMQGLDESRLKGTRVITVETEGADSLSQAVKKVELITLPAITSLATTLGAKRVCKRAFEYGMRESVTTVVVPDSEAIKACYRFANEDRFLVELACAVCPAICYNGKLAELVPNFNENSVVILVICGGTNMSYEILQRYLAEYVQGAGSISVGNT